MHYMFYEASAFDQDLGWCGVTATLTSAFNGTGCASTSCGVTAESCSPTSTPTAAPSLTSYPTASAAPTAAPTAQYVFSPNAELRTAVTLWFNDTAAAIDTYGTMSTRPPA